MTRTLLALLLFFFVTPSYAQDEQSFVRARLVEAIRLLDTFRVESSGQYRDAIRIGKADHSGLPSSIAATGIGLVSLAMADALGIDEKAEEKAIHTLRNLLGDDKESGFDIPRSRRGWFPHFIDPETGERVWGSQDKYSTIDTALLAAGTAVAARYFNAKSFTQGRGESEVWRLGGRVVGGVRWATAIKSIDRGLVHLVFKGEDGEELQDVFANPFDEYAILPCIAMRGEQLGRVENGPAAQLFSRHYARAEDLPMIDFEGVSVIAKPSGNPIPHFTHLFPWFYCNAFNTQPAYRRELRELTKADRAWFARRRASTDAAQSGGFPKALFGLGAGAEVKFHTEPPRKGEVERTGYGVNSLARNPNDTASPAIMAGLASVFRTGEPDDPLRDLMTLWDTKTCRYEHTNEDGQAIPFLWRCSARAPSIPVAKVEAVDFSTYLLGLAARDEAFGMAFLRNFNL